MKKSYLMLCFLLCAIYSFAENETICADGGSGPKCSASSLGYVDPCYQLVFILSSYQVPTGFVSIAKYEWFVNGVSVKTTTNANDPLLAWVVKANNTNVLCKVTYKTQTGTLSQEKPSNTFTPNVKVLNFSDIVALTSPPNYGCTTNPVSYSLNTYTCSGAFCSTVFNANQYNWQISWQPPSGWVQSSISANGNNVSFLPSATAAGALTATITLPCGYTETKTFTVTRAAATPVFAASNSSTICTSSASLAINPTATCGAANYTYTIVGNAGITFASNGLQTLTSSSTSPNLNLSGSNSSFVFKAIANYPGNNVSGEASSSVNFGSPPLSISSSISGCNGSYQVWNLVNNTPSNGSNWNWSVNYLSTPSSQINIYSPTSPSTFVSVTGGGAVRLNYSDLCGVAQSTGVTVYNSSCYGYYRIIVSPNPVKSNMSVSITPESSNQAITNGATTVNNTPVKVIPSTGKTIMSLFETNTNLLVKRWTHNEVSNSNYNFNINGLRKGIYVLQVDRDNQTTITKILIE